MREVIPASVALYLQAAIDAYLGINAVASAVSLYRLHDSVAIIFQVAAREVTA